MDTKILLANIDRHLRILRASDHAISMKAGKQDAIRNLRRYAAGEIKGQWTLDTLAAVATALETTSWELLKPPGAIAADDDLDDRINRAIDARFGPPEPVRKRKSR